MSKPGSDFDIDKYHDRMLEVLEKNHELQQALIECLKERLELLQLLKECGYTIKKNSTT